MVLPWYGSERISRYIGILALRHACLSKAESLSDLGRETILKNLDKSNRPYRTDNELASLTYDTLLLIGFTGSKYIEEWTSFPTNTTKGRDAHLGIGVDQCFLRVLWCS